MKKTLKCSECGLVDIVVGDYMEGDDSEVVCDECLNKELVPSSGIKIGALGKPYTTTGELKDRTKDLEDWMSWVNATMIEFKMNNSERSQGMADGMKLALARFIAIFSEHNE